MGQQWESKIIAAMFFIPRINPENSSQQKQPTRKLVSLVGRYGFASPESNFPN